MVGLPAASHLRARQRPGDHLWGCQPRAVARQSINKVLPPLVRGQASSSLSVPFPPYPWKPVQLRTHCIPDESLAHAYFQGVYVSSLSLNLEVTDGPGEPLHLACGVLSEVVSFLLGEKLVLCRGVCLLECPEGASCLRFARLPQGMRPDRDLQFAALARGMRRQGGVSWDSQLVVLVVDTEGWLTCVGLCHAQVAVDLTAVRFCMGSGLSIIDDIRLHTVDLSGRRWVCLQGTLDQRLLSAFRTKPLLHLARACRPASDTAFVVSGSRAGSFNLLRVRASPRDDDESDLVWLDAVFRKDELHCTGVFYEAAETALQHPVSIQCRTEHSEAFLKEFHMRVIRSFGSIENAWHHWFDLDGSGEINFTEFARGCKKAGYMGNPMRLWILLDDDGGGSISKEELAAGTEGLAEELAAIEAQRLQRQNTVHTAAA